MKRWVRVDMGFRIKSEEIDAEYRKSYVRNI